MNDDYYDKTIWHVLYFMLLIVLFFLMVYRQCKSLWKSLFMLLWSFLSVSNSQDIYLCQMCCILDSGKLREMDFKYQLNTTHTSLFNYIPYIPALYLYITLTHGNEWEITKLSSKIPF